MAPAATASSPSPSPTADQANQSQIPVPLSLLESDSTNLPTPTQRALITALYTLPSATTPDDESQTAIHDLSNLLQDSLARHGWTDRVRTLGLELLRNGSCTTFPELLSEVTRRAKVPRVNEEPRPKSKERRADGRDMNGTTTNGSAANLPNGTGAKNLGANGNNTSISVREGWFGPDGLPDVRIPVATVEDGVDFLKERIKDVVEVVPAVSAEESDSE